MERIFRFDSTFALNRYCAATPIAAQWGPLPSSLTGSARFTGSDSWDEAQALILSGAPDIVKKLSANLDNIARRTSESPRIVRGVAGFAPCVPAALAGRPDSMYARRRRPAQAPVIDIYFDASYNCDVSADTMIEIGSYMLAAVRDIESRGIRVNLHIVIFSEDSRGNVAGLVTRVKSAGDSFSLAAVSYALCHPSFLRRHFFRVLETCPEASMKMPGYGGTCHTVKKHIPAGAILVTGDDFRRNPVAILAHLNLALKEAK